MSPDRAAGDRLEASAVAYLDGLGRFAALGLERIDALTAALGRPERSFAAYHVAGTNGKGSVCAFLASILAAEGVATGLYTSPHLQVPSERILVDQARIAPADLAQAVDAVRAAAPTLPEAPTAFEAWTAVAFWHFARARVAAAVVEVGLGGRGDATAVLAEPVVSVLTTVHRDHVRQLGPTIAHIAAEKAGIFRAGRPVVLGRLGRAAAVVAEGRARALGCPLARLGDEVRVAAIGADSAGRWSFDLEIRLGGGVERLRGLRAGLAGRHQADNAALAVAALRAAERVGGARVREPAIRAGLAEAVWPGRLEGVGDILIDGAHNLQGARALAAHLDVLGGGVVWVLGGLADRPPSDLLDPLLARARVVVATTVASPRARPAAVWARLGARRGRFVATAPDTGAAIARARRELRPDERILVAGSLYLAGEARTVLDLAPPWPRASALGGRERADRRPAGGDAAPAGPAGPG